MKEKIIENMKKVDFKTEKRKGAATFVATPRTLVGVRVDFPVDMIGVEKQSTVHGHDTKFLCSFRNPDCNVALTLFTDDKFAAPRRDIAGCNKSDVRDVNNMIHSVSPHLLSI